MFNQFFTDLNETERENGQILPMLGTVFEYFQSYW